ncbi:hypothetical protein DM01DRAFT_1407259 [Hesseltinella vesiculosa]|uniref:Uncharacterized protein n=1 Tax=Hesseltinella vesiculosa TaxID=101127 RepID=A0A1X2GJE2_9FUNG|nr:hypothetical protein DM01DRAFT_1407259 [Hesseltinella vesiculosa]
MSTDTSTFEAFDNYDFDNDDKFKTGAASIIAKEGDGDDVLLKAKLFYYTRFIQAMDADAYQAWKKVPSTTELGDTVTIPPKLTFQQVVEMIESGQDVPGIRQIPNKLNQGTPSEARLTARRKPWEQEGNE